jgi:hypothetical protein
MKTKEWVSIILFRLIELTFVAGFFIVLALAITKSIPPENKDAVNILLGVLATCVVGIAGYEWGSSRGSDKKNDMLYNSTPTENKEKV